LKGIVAIDIGSQFVKILDVQRDDERMVIRHYGLKEICENGSRMPDERVTQTIQELVGQMETGPSETRTALSGKSVIVRNVDFPNVSKGDILKSIREEENKYIPIDLKEYFFDVGILETPSPEKKSLKGVIAAAKKDAVVNQVNLINNAGLNTFLVDIASLTLLNLYEAVLAKTGKEDAITAVVDLGSSSAHVGILVKGRSIFSREVSTGSIAITRAICDKLSCDFESAEKMKRGGMDSVGEYAAAVVRNLVKELTMSFNFFEGESGMNVQRLFFTGGGVLLKGLAEAISRGVEIPYEIIDPLALFTVDVKEHAEKLKELSPMFAVCAGLAVRNAVGKKEGIA